MSLTFLLIGVSELDIEIAKNMILAGISSLTLYDLYNVNYYNLGGNFYCSEEDVDNNRVAVCKDKLAELNRYVKVQALEGKGLDNMDWDNVLKDYSCVVVSISLPLDTLYKLNETCRSINKGFIYM